MSLPLTERISVGIAPDRIDLVRMKAGWRARVSAGESYPYLTQPGESRAAALEAALREALRSSPSRLSACSVVLSNAFARFAMLPWHEELADPRFRKTYARAQLANMYGPAARSWALVDVPGVYGQPAPVCAVDESLLAAIRSAVRDSGARLVTLRPYFSAAFDRYRRHLGGASTWFAVAEPERICLARVMHGSLTLLRAERPARGAAEELVSMLERELLQAEARSGAERLYVFAPDLSVDTLAALRDIDARRFDPAGYLAALGGDVRFAMALA